MKILFVEDTVELSRAVCYLLRRAAYEADPAFDGAEALERLQQDSYDCIVMDIMMPRMDGITALKTLRNRHIGTPVLLLTAKAEIEDRIAGLDSGADDYLPKPFDFKELLARIRALTRRASMPRYRELHAANVTIDPEDCTVTARSRLCLSNKEFSLLYALTSQIGRAFSAEELLADVWKEEPSVQADTLRLYIAYLKRKLSIIGAAMHILEPTPDRFCLQVLQGQ